MTLAEPQRTLDAAALALRDAKAALQRVLGRVAASVAPNGRIDAESFERHQTLAHGAAWIATSLEALAAMQDWAERLLSDDRCGPLELALLIIAFGDHLAEIEGGLPMSQVETVRLADFGLARDQIEQLMTPAIRDLMAAAREPGLPERVLQLMLDAQRRGLPGEGFGDPGWPDDTLATMAREMTRFAAQAVVPHAHGWHMNDELIPLPVLQRMGELGVFGVTVPTEYGGLGLGKLAMCVVSEVLSRAYLGVGSLGTRSEIASELIRLAGTPDQRARYLPGLASGDILPTAVFTEPAAGSDLASLATRAVRDGDLYRVTGSKTWITHAARSDLMTLLVRTGGPGHSGLSMLLAEKPRGTGAEPFPAKGMRGSEIPVLGYRGMKEYEIAFENFEVPVSALLGGEEGRGFKQLMQTFESARIQTAARSVGVAQNALDLGLAYAQQRQQFGKPLLAFPRVSGKLVRMAASTMAARQLTVRAAAKKDRGERCDVEAGMAKLLGAKVAWANADAAFQIHGGAGYALETPISRVLCDARILNVFEGAAEIQAGIIARGLLMRQLTV